MTTLFKSFLREEKESNDTSTKRVLSEQSSWRSHVMSSWYSMYRTRMFIFSKSLVCIVKITESGYFQDFQLRMPSRWTLLSPVLLISGHRNIHRDNAVLLPREFANHPNATICSLRRFNTFCISKFIIYRQSLRAVLIYIQSLNVFQLPLHRIKEAFKFSLNYCLEKNFAIEIRISRR